MSNINDKATVSLFVNGEQAEDAMDRLRQKAEDLDKQLQTAMAAGDKKTAKSLQRELDKVSKELNRTESAAKGTGVVLNDLGNTSIHGLRNALKHLQKELSMTKPDTGQWRDLAEKVESVKKRIAELNEEMEGSQSLWARFKNWAESTWPAIDLLSRGYDSAVGTLREYVDAYASMDQEMANVRKFTGMTSEQVADLNEEFKKMDTRTSREDLNKLAQEAGRLGKTSKEYILGFVRAADKINVALDDLGDGATLTLSKLTGVFGIEDVYGTEKSLLKVGSVINELSQNCSASAPYLAQFASRMGGVGAQAKMTIPQIMAFGAVLDTNGQAVEASSTALSQVIVRMMQEPAKYAKVAGLDVEKFTNMLKTDVNGALILFLETLQKAGGMDTLSPMFKDMGENGSRAIAALSTLATHIDQVKAQQTEANKAFEEGISIDKEFEVQNTTVQAALDKAKKRFQELRIELGEKLYPLMAHVISSTSAMAKAIKILVDFCAGHKMTIASLVVAITFYNSVLKIHALWLDRVAVKTLLVDKLSKLWALTQKKLSGVIAVGRVAVAALTNAFQYLSNGLEYNYTMQQRWRKAMAGMSFASWTGAIIGIATALFLVYQRLKKLEDERRVIEKIQSDAIKKVGEERVAIDLLVAAADNERLSLDERIKAIDKLNAIIPGYNAQLDETSGKYKANKEALDKYLNSLTKKYELEGAKSKLEELGKEKADASLKLSDAQVNYDNAKATAKSGGGTTYTTSFGMVGNTATDATAFFKSALDSAQAAYDEVERREKRILKAYGVELQKEAARSASSPSNDASVGVSDPVVGGGYVSQTLADKERKKKEAEERRAAAKAKKEFKAELDSYKAQRSAADREVLELYKSGSVDYDELLRRRHENELKYYDDSLAHFEKTFSDQKGIYLQDDKDYQKLLLDRQKSDEKYEQNRIARALENIGRRKSAEERNAQHSFDVKSNPTVSDEIALQAELFTIRKNALNETLALYTEGSKEYADVQYQIETLEQERELTMKKTYLKAVSALRDKYDKKSSTEKYKLEKAALDALLKAEILTAEQYAKYLKGLSEKYKKDLPGEDTTGNKSSWSNKDQTKYEADKKALAEALASNLLTEAEYYRRSANLESEARRKKLQGLQEYGGEWNKLLSDVYLSFADMMDSLQSSPETFLGNLSNCVAAVSSVVGAGMQIATEFAKAESQIQIAAIEKRYDREIELAQGNTYKVAKAEKKKEEETAKVKNEASKKQYSMQVVQAVAQSLVAGLNAYSSTSAIPIVGPALAPAAMAVALAMGATQVALLKKQQQAAEAQGYSQGGFTKPGAVDEPAGIVHAGEWVASQKLLSSPVARPMIEALDYAQRTNTIGSLKPEDVSRSIRANDSLARIAADDGSAALMVAAVAQNARVLGALVDRLNEPFVTVNTVTGPHGINQAQDEYSRLISNKSPKKRRNATNN